MSMFIHMNKIEDISSLSKLINLKYLNLSNNKIEDITKLKKVLIKTYIQYNWNLFNLSIKIFKEENIKMDYIIDINSNLSYINNDYLNYLKYKNINKIIIEILNQWTYDIFKK